MTTHLEKILALAGPAAPPEDPAGNKVLSALEDLRDLQLLLAWSDDDEASGKGGKGKPFGKKQQGKDGGSTKQGGKGDTSKNTKGRDDADDDDDDDDDDGPPWKKNKKKQVKATALVDSAIYALSGLALPQAWDGGGELRLSVMTEEDRKKPGANTIGDSTDYPIPDVGHLQSAVARYKEGKLAGHSKSEVRSHILKHAKKLGKQVDI